MSIIRQYRRLAHAAREMETETLKLDMSIKQEPDWEADQGDGHSPDGPVTEESQASGSESLEQPEVCEAYSDDGVYEAQGEDLCAISKRKSSTDSDEMFPECELDAEPCEAGTSRGLQSKAKVKKRQKLNNALKPFNCDFCGVWFAKSSALVTHVRIHTGEKPFKCSVCGVRFALSGNLKIHFRTHTGEKPYKCDVCGMAFAQIGTLVIHTRTHTGEKPFKCAVCGVAFAEGGTLRKHKRTHTGEKPYKCEVCDVGFSESGTLKRHMRTHTGEKPFKCDHCGTGFARNEHLITHKKLHTEPKS